MTDKAKARAMYTRQQFISEVARYGEPEGEVVVLGEGREAWYDVADVSGIYHSPEGVVITLGAQVASQGPDVDIK